MQSERTTLPHYKLAPGACAVAVHDRLWHDAARRRDVPVRIYCPVGVGAHTTCRPLILFSPGIAAGPDEYAYLGQHWASHGYVSAHVTHPGTDAELLRDVERPWPVIEAALHAPQHRIDRPADLVFAWRALERDAQLGPLIDPARVAVAGHSFGAFTALALVGLTFDMPGRGDRCVAQDDANTGAPPGRPCVASSLRRSVAGRSGARHIRAAIAMSPQGVGIFGLHAHSWDRIAVPVLSLTGTRDKGLLSKRVDERFETFARVPAGEQFLAVLDGASHFAFGDGPGLGVLRPPRVPAHHDYVRQVTVAFLDAYVGAGIKGSRDQGIEEQPGTQARRHEGTKEQRRDGTEEPGRRWLASDAPARMSDGHCFIRWRGVQLVGVPADGPGQTPEWLTGLVDEGQ